jgi:hypothetical protein
MRYQTHFVKSLRLIPLYPSTIICSKALSFNLVGEWTILFFLNHILHFLIDTRCMLARCRGLIKQIYLIVL